MLRVCSDDNFNSTPALPQLQGKVIAKSLFKSQYWPAGYYWPIVKPAGLVLAVNAGP
jgi:hypothetical protein